MVVRCAPLLPGEKVAKTDLLADGHVFMTNYRLVVVNDRPSLRQCSLPLPVIARVDLDRPSAVKLTTKLGSSSTLAFKLESVACAWFDGLSCVVGVAYDSISSTFAHDFRKSIESSIPNHPIFRDWRSSSTFANCDVVSEEMLVYFEFQRMKFGHSWKVSDVNRDFRVCSSYPTHHIVPATTEVGDIVNMANYRGHKRFVSVVWRSPSTGAVIMRCAQPRVGIIYTRNEHDEAFVRSVLSSCQHDPGSNTPKASQRLLIIDARQANSAYLNRLVGGGYEHPDYYDQAEVHYAHIPNIHAVRDAFTNLTSILIRQPSSAAADDAWWQTALDKSGWLSLVSCLLKTATGAAHELVGNGRSVMIHCSDGWDRTPQLTSLTELLVDPYYRSVKGFQVLVNKEFLQFGHKFADRSGTGFRLDSATELSPIFTQWLDCVYQVWCQFPHAFEFNESFLLKLALHTYSGLFGNFLCNSQRDRENNDVDSKTICIWSFLSPETNWTIINHLYEADVSPYLKPDFRNRSLVLWHALYTSMLAPSPNIFTDVLLPTSRICNDDDAGSKESVATGLLVSSSPKAERNSVNNNSFGQDRSRSIEIIPSSMPALTRSRRTSPSLSQLPDPPLVELGCDSSSSVAVLPLDAGSTSSAGSAATQTVTQNPQEPAANSFDAEDDDDDDGIDEDDLLCDRHLESSRSGGRSRHISSRLDSFSSSTFEAVDPFPIDLPLAKASSPRLNGVGGDDCGTSPLQFHSSTSSLQSLGLPNNLSTLRPLDEEFTDNVPENGEAGPTLRTARCSSAVDFAVHSLPEGLLIDGLSQTLLPRPDLDSEQTITSMGNTNDNSTVNSGNQGNHDNQLLDTTTMEDDLQSLIDEGNNSSTSSSLLCDQAYTRRLLSLTVNSRHQVVVASNWEAWRWHYFQPLAVCSKIKQPKRPKANSDVTRACLNHVALPSPNGLVVDATSQRDKFSNNNNSCPVLDRQHCSESRIELYENNNSYSTSGPRLHSKCWLSDWDGLPYKIDKTTLKLRQRRLDDSKRSRQLDEMREELQAVRYQLETLSLESDKTRARLGHLEDENVSLRQHLAIQKPSLIEVSCQTELPGSFSNQTLLANASAPVSSSYEVLESADDLVNGTVVWQPDYEALKCNICPVKFSVLHRKHHCRRCGYLFCGSCSSQYITLPQLMHYKPVRVCDRCFSKVTAAKSSYSSSSMPSTRSACADSVPANLHQLSPSTYNSDSTVVDSYGDSESVDVDATTLPYLCLDSSTLRMMTGFNRLVSPPLSSNTVQLPVRAYSDVSPLLSYCRSPIRSGGNLMNEFKFEPDNNSLFSAPLRPSQEINSSATTPPQLFLNHTLPVLSQLPESSSSCTSAFSPLPSPPLHSCESNGSFQPGATIVVPAGYDTCKSLPNLLHASSCEHSGHSNASTTAAAQCRKADGIVRA